MYNLPLWTLTNSSPAFHDTESGTAIQQTAKVYQAMRDLIDEYNIFSGNVNKKVEEFMSGAEKDFEVFSVGLRQEFQDFIDIIDLKVVSQDKKIDDSISSMEDKHNKFTIEIQNSFSNYTAEVEDKLLLQDTDIANAVKFMKENLAQTITEYLKELRENGELNTSILRAFEDIIAMINAETENRNADIEKVYDAIEEESAERQKAIQTESSRRELSLREEASARKTQDDILSARMDSFVKLPEGSTSGDAELIDIRTDFQGTTHESAGDSVRYQTGEVFGLVREQQKGTKDFLCYAEEDMKDVLYVTDSKGHIIAKIDARGIDSTDLRINGVSVKDIIPDNIGSDVLDKYTDTLYITDSDGNVLFKANKDGVAGIGINEKMTSPYANMKLITIGDSLSAHDKWQKWVAEWTGMKFDKDENVNGKDGHSPMAVGGTALRPDKDSSIYIRALDTKHYLDEENGTVIIIYAGQNDGIGTAENNYMYLGTIDDEPYTDRVIKSENGTFYSNYMGLVENLLVDCPSAKIFLMTNMKMWESETDTSDTHQRDRREKKAAAIREIAKKYSLPCIDQWEDSGVNFINAPAYYPEAGNVHNNDYGYKQTALTVYRTLV